MAKVCAENLEIGLAVLAAIEKAGNPVARFVVNDLYDLGQIFFQWEIATAVAGSVIGINAFDQPNDLRGRQAPRFSAVVLRDHVLSATALLNLYR